ncbi:DUF1700 domain-containing protein [Cohnella sp. GCM10027633]|uniref:DUF1700 domain-containing protein n=1 Tax=unclassified Cohnella TaxID=2636738 RepID=UPI0036373B52
MTKQEYLSALRYYLAPMPAPEREELLLDYESHFDSGAENGRSEAETATMLGDPLAIAKDILGPNFYFVPNSPAPPRRDIARMIGVTIALVFLNMVALPALVSIWAGFVSICAVAVFGCLSLFILLVEQLAYGDATIAKLFLAIGSTGVGMLLAYFVRYYGIKWILFITIGYWKWTERTWLGRT